MKKIKTIIICTVCLVLIIAACILIPHFLSSNKEEIENKNSNISGLNTAVIYFSYSGTTEKIAKYIANTNGADLIELEPTEPYTAEDTSYGSKTRTTVEQNNKEARPGLKTKVDISNYDVIYLGYPIWYSDTPRIIYTFLDENDIDGKYVIPFCTSSSTDIKNTEETLKSYRPNAKWLEGKRFSAIATEDDVSKWVKSF